MIKETDKIARVLTANKVALISQEREIFDPLKGMAASLFLIGIGLIGTTGSTMSEIFEIIGAGALLIHAYGVGKGFIRRSTILESGRQALQATMAELPQKREVIS